MSVKELIERIKRGMYVDEYVIKFLIKKKLMSNALALIISGGSPYSVSDIPEIYISVECYIAMIKKIAEYSRSIHYEPYDDISNYIVNKVIPCLIEHNLMNEEIIITLISIDYLLFSSIPNKFINETILIKIVKNGELLRIIPKNLITIDICISALSSQSECVDFIPNEFWNEKLYVIALFSPKNCVTKVLDIAATNNHNISNKIIEIFVKRLIKYDYHKLSEIPDKFRSIDICKLFVEMSEDNIEYIPDDLLTIDLSYELCYLNASSINYLEYFNEKLKIKDTFIDTYLNNIAIFCIINECYTNRDIYDEPEYMRYDAYKAIDYDYKISYDNKSLCDKYDNMPIYTKIIPEYVNKYLDHEKVELPIELVNIIIEYIY